LAGAVFAALLVTVVSAPAGASSMRLFVNGATGHDTGACTSPATPCATISYALAHAPAGAKIKVAPGVYQEQLTITQSVTIIGRSPKLTRIAPPSVAQNDTDPDKPVLEQYPIVDVHNAGQTITNVNLERLTIDGSGSDSFFSNCNQNLVGVYYHNASGEMVGVRVVNILLPQSLFGCQPGDAVQVHSDVGSTANVTMRHLVVNNYTKLGIVCKDPGTSCTINHSVVTGIGPTPLVAQNGVEIFGARSVVFNHDTVSGNTYSGINCPTTASGLLIINTGSVGVRNSTFKANDVNTYALEDPGITPTASPGNWTFAGNLFENATDDAPAINNPPCNAEGQGYGDGLDIDSSTSPVTIRGNMAKSNFEYGIALYGATDATMSGNAVNANYDGIYVGGPGTAASASTGNTITGNRALSNKNDGILADVTAADSANSFIGNTLHGSAHLEAQDRSTGGGTAGTANTWTGNRCGSPHSASPTGIC
jgi:parallel beta-helix repeat protein